MRYEIFNAEGGVINTIVADVDFVESVYTGSYREVSDPPNPPTRDDLKAQREFAVSQIKVTTAAGNTFDGDEVSQGRMARAVIALSTGLAPSVTWVLADNSMIQATAAELTEALMLAGAAQANLWVI